MGGSIRDTAPRGHEPAVIVEPLLAERLLLLAIEFGERTGDSRVAVWRRRRDAAYCAGADQRAEGFDALALQSFHEMGHRARVLDVLRAMPRLSQATRSLRLAMPRGGQAEGADISGAGRRPVVGSCDVAILVRPEKFMDAERFRTFLLLELEHLEETLDPEFGYDPSFEPSGSANVRRMAGERLRDLWAARAAQALAARGLVPLPSGTTLAGLDAATSADLLREAARPAAPFSDLMRAAQDPIAYLEARGLRPSRALMPSAPCPLCGFPTWEWAAAGALAAAAEGIGRELPGWREADGACARCVEGYVGATA